MKSGPIIAFLGMAVILAVFGSLEIHGLRVLILQSRAESFPVAKGEILSGEVEITHGSKGHIYYEPSFSYDFQVNGKIYTGRQYRYGASPFSSDREATEDIVNGHPVGSEIEVYYNPANPRDSVLSPRVNGCDFGNVLMPFSACLALSYWMVKFAWEMPFLKRVGAKKKSISFKKTRGRHSQYMPLPTSLVTVGLLCLFAGAVMMSTPSAGIGEGTIVLLIIGFAGGIVYLWRYKSVFAGCNEGLGKKRAARTE